MTKLTNSEPTTSNAGNLRAVLPLFLVIFIDAMGLAIMFPILTPIFMNLHVHGGILAAGASLLVRNIFYGVTLCIFPLFMFFGTPFLGDLSDHIGRKKVLIICLLGATVSYFLSGLSVDFKVVWLLLVSRAVAGFTAGSQPIAQAAIIDVSPPDKKALNLSLLLFPAALGFR